MKNHNKSSIVRLVEYITDDQRKAHRVGEVVITNCAHDDPDLAAREMLLTQLKNRRAKSDKTYHLMVSFRPGEDPTPETIRRVESELCKRLGFAEHQRIAVVHRDTDSVLGIYKDVVTARNTAESDFKILDIMNADKPVSLYLITTPDNKDRLCPLLRLLINMMLKKLAAKVDYKDGRTVMAHKRRLLMMLDEFPSFGKLQPIADGLAFVAGYGLKIYIISQDTVQFDAIYTDKNSIISNCHIQVMFPLNCSPVHQLVLLQDIA